MKLSGKGGRSFGSALCIVAAMTSPLCVQGAEVFARFESQTISEPEPLRASISDWGSEFSGGERQWSVNHLEVGARYHGIEVSVQQRLLADLRMNREATEQWGRIERKEPLVPGERVPVRVQVDGFSAQALRLGYRHEMASGWIGAGVSLLWARHVMLGELNGELLATDEQDFDFNADVDYIYYRDVLFDRPDIREADGLGWAVDLAARWQIGDRWRFHARADDLLAKIRWRDAPFTQAAANTDNKSYDDDGFAIFDPILSGREGYRDRVYQAIDPRYRAGVELSEGSWLAIVRAQYQFGYGFAGLGGGWQYTDGSRLRVLYWPKLESVGVEYERGQWRFGLSVDSPQWRDVRALGVTISRGY